MCLLDICCMQCVCVVFFQRCRKVRVCGFLKNWGFFDSKPFKFNFVLIKLFEVFCQPKQWKICVCRFLIVAFLLFLCVWENNTIHCEYIN